MQDCKPIVYGDRELVDVDFRSVKSGTWKDPRMWEVFEGAAWRAASIGEYPQGSNAVFIQAGHTVTLRDHELAKDLHLDTTADQVRLDTADWSLTISGQLRGFTGAAPGIDSAAAGAAGMITGVIVVNDSTLTLGPLTEAASWTGGSHFSQMDLQLLQGNKTIGSEFQTADLDIEGGTWDFQDLLTATGEILISGGVTTLNGIEGPAQVIGMTGGRLNISAGTNSWDSLGHVFDGIIASLEPGANEMPINVTGPPYERYKYLLGEAVTVLQRQTHIAGSLQVAADLVIDRNGHRFYFGPGAGLEYVAQLDATATELTADSDSWILGDHPSGDLPKFVILDRAGGLLLDTSHLVPGELRISEGAINNLGLDTIANRVDTDQDFIVGEDTIAAGGVDNNTFLTDEEYNLIAAK